MVIETNKLTIHMRNLKLFALVALFFAACNTDALDEREAGKVGDFAPETITVGFEDDTRIQLQYGKTVWTKNDEVSVFYLSDANQKWQYKGATGNRTAQLSRVDAGVATKEMDKVIVVYPYNANYFIHPATQNIKAWLPATQSYLKDSYGLDGNIMISQSEYNQFSLKNVCGWLKVKLTGFGDVIKSIKVKGNNGEQVAGELYINPETAIATLAAADGEANDDDGSAGGTLVFDDTILYETTLDCGEGVELGLAATDFYIALPPQTFEKGITITVEDANGFAMTKSTDKVVTIDRNHILPMKSFTFVNPNNGENDVIGHNQIWYTASKQFTPYYDTKYYFGANLESNVWNAETGLGVLTFDGVVTMIGEYAFKNCTSLKSIVIPESVTSLGEGAFYGCENLASITIPESVEEIGTYAFTLTKKLAKFEGKYASDDGRTLVKDGAIFAYAWASGDSYTIPEGVTAIADYAFYYCDGIKRVSIPEYVTTIGLSAFERCEGLTDVYVDSSIIGNSAFQGCRIKNLTLGNHVTELYYEAFFSGNQFETVTIPESVIYIGGDVFMNCDKLKSVYVNATTPATLNGGVFYGNASGRKIYVPVESVEAYKSALNWNNYADAIVGYEFNSGGNSGIVTENHKIYYTATKETAPYFTNSFYFGANLESNVWNAETGLGVLTFDGVVTMIGDYAFKNCTSLQSIVIPESVTSLGEGAFYGCENLASITIPESVKEIGTYAFTYTKKLAKFEGKYASEDGRTLVKDGAIFAYAWASGDSYTIPEGVTAIADYAFYYCDGIKRVSIPEYVTTIGLSAFERCEGLTDVYVDSSIIGNSAFQGCRIKNLTLGNHVTELYYEAFFSGNQFETVTIPESVIYIGGDVFMNCDKLKSVYVNATTPATLNGGVFYGNASGRKIYVPVESVEAYKSALNWNNYADAIVGYEF